MPTLTRSLILEGPNGAGKSTLAKKLQAYYSEDTLYPPQIVHATKSTSKVMAARDTLSQLVVNLTGHAAIYDRSHAISRMVYQADSLDAYEGTIMGFSAGVQSEYAIIIYCTGEGQRDMNKPHYTEELKEETRDQKKIRALYDLVLMHLPHIKYNFEKDDFNSLLSQINAL